MSNTQSETVVKTPGLKDVIKECKGAFKLLVGMTLVINILSIAPILYILNIFDRVLSSQSLLTLASLTFLIVVIYLFWSGLEWLRNRVMVRISLRLDWDLAADLFDTSFRKTITHQRVNVNQTMNDLLTLRQFLTGPAVIAVIDAPFAILYILIAYVMHPWIAIFIVGATALLLIMGAATRYITTPALEAANQQNVEASRVATAVLKNVETAEAMGMLPRLRNMWHDKHREYLQHQVNSTESSGFVGVFSGVLTKALPSLQMGVAVILAVRGDITAGMVIAASFLMSKSISPITGLIGRWKDIVNARMAFNRVDQLLKDKTESKDHVKLPDPVGHIQVSELLFTAPNSDRKILQNIQFELSPGSVLAVVGPNGSGKSTLMKLLLGVWKPTDGSVRLDGVEISDWPHEEVGDFLGYVAQEPSLFEGSVAQNIARMGAVDSDKVIAAAKGAGIHEMVLAFPQGYETQIGTGEFVLSGGQAQRIAIARALYGDPKLLVMDEPNSNLDDRAEQELIRTLNRLKAIGHTVVISTHQKRMIALTDYMLVLNQGRMASFGPTAKVLEAFRGSSNTAAATVAAEPVGEAAV